MPEALLAVPPRDTRQGLMPPGLPTSLPPSLPPQSPFLGCLGHAPAPGQLCSTSHRYTSMGPLVLRMCTVMASWQGHSGAASVGPNGMGMGTVLEEEASTLHAGLVWGSPERPGTRGAHAKPWIFLDTAPRTKPEGGQVPRSSSHYGSCVLGHPAQVQPLPAIWLGWTADTIIPMSP